MRRNRPGRSGAPTIVPTVVYGPEPIGADAQDALDAQIGVRISSPSVVAAGLAGYDDQSYATFAQPADFSPLGAMRSPIIATDVPGQAPDDGDNALPPNWSG